MSLFTINIYSDNEQVLKEIKHLKDIIMGTFAELKTEFGNVKTAIAEEVTQINAKLDELQNANEGGTAEERQALIDDMRATVERVKAIIPDATQPTE